MDSAHSGLMIWASWVCRSSHDARPIAQCTAHLTNLQGCSSKKNYVGNKFQDIFFQKWMYWPSRGKMRNFWCWQHPSRRPDNRKLGCVGTLASRRASPWRCHQFRRKSGLSGRALWRWPRSRCCPARNNPGHPSGRFFYTLRQYTVAKMFPRLKKNFFQNLRKRLECDDFNLNGFICKSGGLRANEKSTYAGCNVEECLSQCAVLVLEADDGSRSPIAVLFNENGVRGRHQTLVHYACAAIDIQIRLIH